ncbi:disease resistance protein RPM1-like isoform X1 [Typha angustifolia]|uniref:disease resistance protein RPM1-like isoform X1 n=1 Tax=Typha angustifolia TaxID=59011 RepID=UPI003C2B0D41
MEATAVAVSTASLAVALTQLALQGEQFKQAKQGPVLQDIENRLSSIKNELLAIQCFRDQLDMTKGDNPLLEAWIAQVSKLAYGTQDLVDEYIHILSQQQGYKFGDITRLLIDKCRTSIALTGIVTQLKNIEEEVTKLSNRKDQWVQMPRQVINNTSDRACHILDEKELVGIENDREILVRLLQSEECAFSIVSVWGMGGLGKTTLVTNVYKRESQNFGCHAWVSISQSYKIDDILRILIKKLYGEGDRVPDDIQSMDAIKLKEILRIFLEHKRYLIILDDVWNPKAFHDLCDCLVDNDKRSRIIITTRIDGVASLAHDRCKLQLKPLGDEEAWDLFCKRMFRDHVCPSEIDKCAKEFVTKCQGLPLAIVSVGRLLSSLGQQTESKWSRVYHRFNWELEQNSSLEDLRNVLYLSYKDLPTYLKSCFLYCSMFPEDYLLSKKRLIRLWIAEGFVLERGSNTLEEVAEDHLNELIKRSMLQVVEMNNKRRFRMHHLMRELTLVVSAKATFHAVVYNNSAKLKVDGDVRRLAVHNCSEDVLSSIYMPLLRTFLALHCSTLSSSFLSPNLSKSKYLAVLDLDGAALKTLPDVIVDLFNLRYLSLRNSKVESLPKSIEKLSNLETLDLYGSMIKELPHGIVKLEKLRYLNVMEVKDGSGTSTPLEAPKGLWNIKVLQTLKGVKASRDLVKGLKNLTQLRSLAIFELKDYHFMHLSASLSQMRLLSRLVLFINGNKYDNLTLGRELLFCDGWLPNLHSLRELQLKGGNIPKEDSSRLSEKMKYIFLDLYQGDQQLVFRDGWFPNLQSLIIENIGCVNQVKMEKGTMVRLHTLVLKGLGELKEVPQGIEFLTSLQFLNFSESHSQLKARLQESEVRGKLQHIANIYID